MAQNQIKSVNWWHERFADIMIANPQMTLGQIAKQLGVTQPWLSQVKNSDCFIDYWRVRSVEHSKAVTTGVKEKIAGTTEMVLDNLADKVSDMMEAEALGIDQSLQILSTLNKYGYGQTAKEAPQLNLHLSLASPEMLAQARKRLRGEAPAEPLELEAQVVEVSSG